MLRLVSISVNLKKVGPLLALLSCMSCAAPHAVEAETVRADSPDKANTIEVFGMGVGAEQLGFRISRGDCTVMEITNFTVSLAEIGELSGLAKLRDVKHDTVDEIFSLPWGKTRDVVNRCTQITIRLTDEQGVDWEIDLAAYDDGVAYRYRLPKQKIMTTFTLTEETASVRFSGVPTLHYTALNGFTTDHEAEFHRDELTGVRGPLVDLPLLAVWPDGLAAGMTEARVRDFPNLYLEPSADLDSELFHTRLSPLPGIFDCGCIGRPSINAWKMPFNNTKTGASAD